MTPTVPRNKEAEGTAFRELLASVQGENQPLEKVVLRQLFLMHESGSGGHATLSDVLVLLMNVQSFIGVCESVYVSSYIQARYPFGSTFQVQVIHSIELSGASEEADFSLGPGTYTIEIVEHDSVAWGQPKGLDYGISMKFWLMWTGVLPSSLQWRARMISDSD